MTTFQETVPDELQPDVDAALPRLLLAKRGETLRLFVFRPERWLLGTKAYISAL